MTRRKLGWVLGGLMVLVVAGGALAAHSRFTDVTDDHPVDAIEWAADQEITLGCDTDKFCPDEPLKRKHARVFIERFYDQVLGAEGDDQFTNPDFTRADMMALLHSMVGELRSLLRPRCHLRELVPTGTRDTRSTPTQARTMTGHTSPGSAPGTRSGLRGNLP